MTEKVHELTNIRKVVQAEAVVNPVNIQPSAPVLVGGDCDINYVAVAVSEDEVRLNDNQNDFTLDYVTEQNSRTEARENADTVVRTNEVRRNFLDADVEAVARSENSCRAEARATNMSVHAANNVRPDEVLQYDPELHSKVGKTELDNVNDSEYKTKYTVDKKPIGNGYSFASDSYETTEYKFGCES